MNAIQRIVLLVASVVVVGMALYPPWQYRVEEFWASYSYAWIFAPPDANHEPGAAEKRYAARLSERMAERNTEAERLRESYEDYGSRKLRRKMEAEKRRLMAAEKPAERPVVLSGPDSAWAAIAQERPSYVRLDTARLGFQLFAVLMLTGALLVVLQERRKPGGEVEQEKAS